MVNVYGWSSIGIVDGNINDSQEKLVMDNCE